MIFKLRLQPSPPGVAPGWALFHHKGAACGAISWPTNGSTNGDTAVQGVFVVIYLEFVEARLGVVCQFHGGPDAIMSSPPLVGYLGGMKCNEEEE